MTTLMYQVSNELHPGIKTRRADLPPCVRSLMNRVVAKDLEQHCQRGDEFSQTVRHCLDSQLTKKRAAAV